MRSTHAGDWFRRSLRSAARHVGAGPIVAALVVLLLLPAAAAQAPEQVRITPGFVGPLPSVPEANGLVVHWTTLEPYRDAPVVRWSGSEGATTTAAALVGDSRDTSPVAEFSPRFHYAATLPVSRNQTITYQVGSPAGGFSQEFTARSLPPFMHGTTVAVAADWGYAGYDRVTGQKTGPSTSEQLIGHLLNRTPAAVISPGDIGASTSTAPWDIALRIAQPLAATTPIVPARSVTDATSNEFAARFVMPYSTEGQVGGSVQQTAPDVASADDVERYFYSLSIGAAYFVILDSPTFCGLDQADVPVIAEPAQPTTPPCDRNGPPNPEQYNWLRELFEDLREDVNPAWIVVVMHHSPYVWADDGGDQATRQIYTPVFETWNVDLVIGGHEGVYQRTHPLLGGFPVAQTATETAQGLAPIYINTGGSGGDGGTPGPAPLPSWLATSDGRPHVTYLRITDEALTVEAVDRDTNETFDAFTIHRHGTPAAMQLRQGPAPAADKGSPAPLLVVPLLAALLRRR